MEFTTGDFISSIFISIMNNIVFMLSLLLVVLIAACFLGRYVVLTKKLIFSSLGILALTILWTVIVNVFFGESFSTEFYMLTNSLLTLSMFVYSFFFYFFAYKERRFLRAVESTICFYILTVYISTFCQVAVVYFAGGTDAIVEDVFFKKLGYGPLWITISAASLLITLALFVIVYFGFYRKKKYMRISIPYRIIFAIWTTLFVIFPLVPAAVPEDQATLAEKYQIISIFFGIFIVLLGLAIPVTVVVASAERALNEKNKSQEAYLSAQLEYIGQYKKKQIETQRFRHDIKNNLMLTQMMLEEGHTDEAREHVKDMLGNVSSLSPKYVTGDEMLDLIVSMKADKMDELGISFELDGVVDGGLNIKPMDMCSIFANALDNAIEAASSCEAPHISLNIKRTDKFFVIKITNSASKKIDAEKLLSSSGYTSKKDKDHHGFGLMNVRRAVEVHNGILKADSQADSFTLSIMLPRQA